MATLVDSSVLLDVFTEDPTWLGWSRAALAGAAEAGTVVVDPIIYAEVSTRFSRIEDLDEALAEFVNEPLPWAAGFLAAKAFLSYRQRGGLRTSTLPDFYIGAHAAVSNHTLLTRDPRRLRTYFPSVHIVSPQ